MLDAIAATLPDQWQLMFRIFTFPVAWLPDFQAMLIEISWHGSSGTAVFMKRTFLLLPILLVIVALWNTMLAVYTVPFRHQRGQFLISIVLLWWEVGRSISRPLAPDFPQRSA